MPAAVELADRLQPRARVRRVRLGRPPRLLVERRHRQARADVRDRGDLLHQVEVAQQQRRLRQDRARVARSRASPPRSRASACSGPRPTGTGRCSCPARSCSPLPRRPRELLAQHLGHVDLDHDLLLEVAARVEVQVLVRRAGEAVDAGMVQPRYGLTVQLNGTARAGRDVVERATSPGPRRSACRAPPERRSGARPRSRRGPASRAGSSASTVCPSQRTNTCSHTLATERNGAAQAARARAG